MTQKELEIVVAATMQYVRRTYNVRSFTNAEILKQVEKVIDSNFNLEINSWRKVEDGLPPCMKDTDISDVVLATNGTTYHVARYMHDRQIWTCDWIDVTHWMPLPKLPQKQTKEKKV